MQFNYKFSECDSYVHPTHEIFKVLTLVTDTTTMLSASMQQECPKFAKLPTTLVISKGTFKKVRF